VSITYKTFKLGDRGLQVISGLREVNNDRLVALGLEAKWTRQGLNQIRGGRIAFRTFAMLLMVGQALVDGKFDALTGGKTAIGFVDIVLRSKELALLRRALLIEDVNVAETLRGSARQFASMTKLLSGLSALLDGYIAIQGLQKARGTGQTLGHGVKLVSSSWALTESIVAVAMWGMPSIPVVTAFFALTILVSSVIGDIVLSLFPDTTPWEDLANLCFLGRRTQNKPHHIVGIYTDYRKSVNSQWAAFVLLINRFSATLGYQGLVTIDPGPLLDQNAAFYVRWEFSYGNPLPTVRWTPDSADPEQVADENMDILVHSKSTVAKNGSHSITIFPMARFTAGNAVYSKHLDREIVRTEVWASTGEAKPEVEFPPSTKPVVLLEAGKTYQSFEE
jgi:hypothetical protein